jgi:hypothetical protein
MGKPARIPQKPVEDYSGRDYVNQVVVQGLSRKSHLDFCCYLCPDFYLC